jgi:hypothetical protein
MKIKINKRTPERKQLIGYFLLLIYAILFLLIYFSISNKFNKNINYIERSDIPIINPLMGWAPWATLTQIYQPHTLVYADLTWKDFEPLEGFFDFEKFERVQQFSRWRQEGKRVVFRFVLDVPRAVSHIDIPDWLFEKINQEGDFYDNEYGKGFSPNYSNPELIKYHQLALKALGDRYNNDGFIAFVEIGSVGHWGEWYLKSDLQTPSEKIRNLYVQHYIESFPDVYLLMRRPFKIAKDFNLGLYNDMTGDSEQTNSWLNWIAHGGDYLPTEKNSLVAMPDGWLFAPIGGEQTPTLSNEYVYGNNLEETLNLLRESHSTFIGPNGPYNVKFGDPLQTGLDRVLTTLGYRLYIVSTEMPSIINYGREVEIKINISNAGIAPFYYDWVVKLYLLDEAGEIVRSYPISLDLKEIIPNEIYTLSSTIDIVGLENQKYIVGFAIIDPFTGMPGVKLANQSTRNDLMQEIGSFEIKKIFGDN